MPETRRPAAPRTGRRWWLAFLLTTVLSAAIVGGCGVVSTVSPAPTPADFPGVAIELIKRGLVIDHLVSGDAGCDDPVLTPTAIGFDASGLDQPTVIRAHIYIFRDRETYDRLRTSVDSCARSFVTDPETYESAETSPFVVAAQGPWGPKFEAALRAGLEAAAGTGG